LHRKNSHAFYSLKMLKGFYLTTKGELSELSSIRWMNLGMTSNGKCLTVKTSVSPRTENASSLSDILEEQVAPKYFLSDKQTKYILETITEKSQSALIPTIIKDGSITAKEHTFGQTNRVHDPKGISPTVPTASGGRHIPMICESADSLQPNVNDSKDSLMDGQKEYPIPNDTNVSGTQ
jgi:hypothetical protein